MSSYAIHKYDFPRDQDDRHLVVLECTQVLKVQGHIAIKIMFN